MGLGVNLLLGVCHRTSLMKIQIGAGDCLVPSGNKRLLCRLLASLGYDEFICYKTITLARLPKRLKQQTYKPAATHPPKLNYVIIGYKACASLISVKYYRPLIICRDDAITQLDKIIDSLI